jgi:2-haloacid dehalogenase
MIPDQPSFDANPPADSNHLAFVFDFGGVLLDWNLHYLFREFFNNDDTAVDHFLAEVHFREYNDQKDCGRPYSDICTEMCRRYPQYEKPLRAYGTRWLETIGGPIQPVVEILGTIKRSGRRLYGLSNFSVDNFLQIRQRYSFFDYFDGILLSAEAGVVKPDPRIFAMLLQRIGRRAEECLLIDDTAVNIEAARKLGFRTIHYQGPQQLQEELITHKVWF